MILSCIIIKYPNLRYPNGKSSQYSSLKSLLLWSILAGYPNLKDLDHKNLCSICSITFWLPTPQNAENSIRKRTLSPAPTLTHKRTSTVLPCSSALMYNLYLRGWLVCYHPCVHSLAPTSPEGFF